MGQQGSGDLGGWRPLMKPPDQNKGALARRLNTDGSPIVTSFVRLARTHAFHAAGDATYAVALVGSIFALDTDAARGRILLYLLLTLAPFALVGPFIGPALDRVRGGRRLMIMLTLAARAVIMLALMRNIETFWLFPIAFSQLVMAKTYSVAKAATVPTTVSSEEELVDKNARLAVLGTVAGAIGAAPALGLQALFGSTPTVVYAFIVYALGVVAATRLPRVVVDDPQESDDQVDIRSAGVRLAATAMSVMRGIAGFVFWLMVFAFGSNDIDTDGVGKAAGLAVRFALGFSIEGDNSQPAWKLGFVLASIGAGIFLGNVLAPRLRERFVEETMIIGALGTILGAAIAAVWAGGLSGAVLLALVVGAAPASAKLAFDSLVQRDAPGANHGAAFGRFETRFQIASVIGSVLAVAPTVVIPVRIGSFFVAVGAAIAGAMYVVGSRALRDGRAPSFLSFGRSDGDDRGEAQVPDGFGADGEGRPGDPPRSAPATNPESEPASYAGGPAQRQPVPGPTAPGQNPQVVYTAAPTTQVRAVAPQGLSPQPPAAPDASRSESRPPPASPPASHAPLAPPPPRGLGAHTQPTEQGPADPYAQGFAERPVEPPAWSSTLFDGDEVAADPLGPAEWINEPSSSEPQGFDPTFDPFDPSGQHDQDQGP